jgi:putative membrane protein
MTNDACGRTRANRRDPRDLQVGDPIDPRFTLANERTFLAWNRTALTLVAGLRRRNSCAPDLAGRD